jgi:tetratricopeptide (TPR) repeat protein
MTSAATFVEILRREAQGGAGEECTLAASQLMQRAALVAPPRAEALQRAGRGLRIAARILRDAGGQEAPSRDKFGPAGIRGAIAAGHVALVQGRPVQAELVGCGLQEAAPRSPAGLRLIGQALFAQGRYRRAMKAYRGSLAIAPDDDFTRALYAEALWFSGERDTALSSFASIRAAGGPGSELARVLEEAIRCGALPKGLPCARWTAP